MQFIIFILIIRLFLIQPPYKKMISAVKKGYFWSSYFQPALRVCVHCSREKGNLMAMSGPTMAAPLSNLVSLVTRNEEYDFTLEPTLIPCQNNRLADQVGGTLSMLNMTLNVKDALFRRNRLFSLACFSLFGLVFLGRIVSVVSQSG